MAPLAARWKHLQSRRQVVMLMISAAFFLGYQCTVAQPIMGFSLRFFAPVMPVLGLLGLFLSQSFMNTRRIAALSLFILTLLTPLSYAGYVRDSMAFNDLSLYRQFAWALQAADPVRRTMAIGDAGIIPYITDWRVIDLNGHNDPVLARHLELEVETVFKQNPELVIPGSAGWALGSIKIGNYNQTQLRQGLDKRGYVFLGTMITGGHPPVDVYARPDYAKSKGVAAIRQFLTRK